MGDGFIVRRGGGAVAGEPIPQPTITLVSKTDSSITFTLTNNSAEEQDVTFGLTTPPTTTTITLASQATSGNQTFSNLDDDTTFIIFAQAADGVIGQLSVTTDKTPVFTAATGGTTLEYDSGGKRFKSHTFTSNGNFVVSTVGDNVDDRNKVDYLIVAGGGGGGSAGNSGRGPGGGGAGGYRTTIDEDNLQQIDVLISQGLRTLEPKVTITETTFGITIGGGASQRNNGGSSTAFGITSTGGGGAGDENNDGKNGGSGGGGSRVGISLGGTGIANQGFKGGDVPAGLGNGAGGGGAGSIGSNNVAAGIGLGSSLRNGTIETRSVGGTGAGSSGTAGAVNTGDGGDARAPLEGAGFNGGSGVVVIRYEIAPSV